MQHVLVPEKWVDNYADYLFSFAAYRLNQKELAEDLVQETFLSAWKAMHEFKGLASEKTWLTGILKNKIIDTYRKHVRTKKVMDESVELNYFFSEGEHSHWTEQAAPNSNSMNAIDQLQQKELNTILERCLELLPETWNRISKLKLIDEEKTEVICKNFDITPSNLWVIIHRAKLQLRDCIDKKWNHA